MCEAVANRKRIELEQKVNALEDELESWCKKSEAKGPFEKHHTQIRAVRAHMQGWNVQVRKKLDEYNVEKDADIFLSKCLNAEKLILSEHRIWDYFRSKFIQRNESSFHLYLAAADEFAWLCYKPFQELIYPDPSNVERKEPPLVFFNGGVSPFSLSRDRSFQPELVAGETLNVDPRNIANKLPIPVVGIPWQQISHLPEALVIGHEVGHIVEDDFHLNDGLKQILDESLKLAGAQARKEAWHSWLGEIFADLYGCLASGPAFAGAMIDFLAKDRSRISTEEKTSADWGRYPTDYLRVVIILKALETMGFEEEVRPYKDFWKTYSSKMPAEYLKDIEEVIPKLLLKPHPNLSGRSIMSVFCFSTNQQKKVDVTTATLNKIEPGKAVEIPSTDILVLFAALRMSFEKWPDEYNKNRYGERVLIHIQKNVIASGVRSGEQKLEKNALERRLEAYKKAGTELINEYIAAEKMIANQ